MKTSTKVFIFLILAASAVSLAARLNYEFNVLGEARKWWDSPAYLRISTGSLLSLDFYVNSRPFVYPLVLKLFQRNLEVVFRFQVLFSALAWGILAWSTARSLKNRWVGLAAFALVLLFSLDRHILGWDTLILTESVSLSLMALLLAGWLWLLRGWSPIKAAALIVLGLLAAFLRDTHAWLMLMQAGLLILALILMRRTAENELSRHKRGLFLIAGLFIAGFFLSNLSSNLGGRWYFPFQNTLAERILPDPQARAFFESCGLPVSDELLKLANSQDQTVNWDETPEAFQVWRNAKGKSCYALWLITNPVSSLTRPFSDFGATLLFPSIETYFGPKFKPLLPAVIANLVYPGALTLWIWGLKLFVIGLAFWKRADRQNPAWWLLLALLALEYPHYLLIWHGDAADLPRHALLVSVLHQYSLWLAAALSLDGWLSRRGNTRLTK
jgi:hypothetical protein